MSLAERTVVDLLAEAEDWGMEIHHSTPVGTIGRWEIRRPAADKLESSMLLTLRPGKRHAPCLTVTILDAAPIDGMSAEMRIAKDNASHWLAVLAGAHRSTPDRTGGQR